MAEYFTDAPVLVVRQVAGYNGCGYYPASIGEPTWVETVLDGRGQALAWTVQGLLAGGYKVEPEGKGAIANPTYAMAASTITRSSGGSSGSPAPIFTDLIYR